MDFQLAFDKLIYELSSKNFTGTFEDATLHVSYKHKYLCSFKVACTNNVFCLTIKSTTTKKTLEIDGVDALYDAMFNYCQQSTKELVVHCKLKPYDIYIGRGKCPNTGEYSEWHNPYSAHENSVAEFTVATREESLERFEQYLDTNEYLKSKLHTLKGLVLGCWCKTKQKPLQECHGDIIIKYINKYEERNDF